jgi:transcriptional regulator with XRE-family HTH domain
MDQEDKLYAYAMEGFAELRKDLNYSQRKMSDELSINQSTLSRIEQGKRLPKYDLVSKALKLKKNEWLEKLLAYL